VRCVEADFCYASSPEEEAKLFQNHMAGGSLLDVGVYGLHFSSLFLGSSPQKVCAAADVRDGVDLHTHVLLQYSNGAVAKVSSAIQLYKPEDAYIYGTKGFIYLPVFYGAQELVLHIGDEHSHIKKPSIGDGFEEEIYEVCHCIRSGRTESDILPLSESIRMMEIMDEIRKQIGVRYSCEG